MVNPVNLIYGKMPETETQDQGSSDHTIQVDLGSDEDHRILGFACSPKPAFFLKHGGESEDPHS